jgi:hypothetical protein
MTARIVARIPGETRSMRKLVFGCQLDGTPPFRYLAALFAPGWHKEPSATYRPLTRPDGTPRPFSENCGSPLQKGSRLEALAKSGFSAALLLRAIILRQDRAYGGIPLSWIAALGLTGSKVVNCAKTGQL